MELFLKQVLTEQNYRTLRIDWYVSKRDEDYWGESKQIGDYHRTEFIFRELSELARQMASNLNHPWLGMSFYQEKIYSFIESQDSKYD